MTVIKVYDTIRYWAHNQKGEKPLIVFDSNIGEGWPWQLPPQKGMHLKILRTMHDGSEWVLIVEIETIHMVLDQRIGDSVCTEVHLLVIEYTGEFDWEGPLGDGNARHPTVGR